MPSKAQKGSVAFAYRSSTNLLTLPNSKTAKGEYQGYLSAILYLAPHTSGSKKTLCPYSTAACREMCLSGAGLSGLPRQMKAKQDRTDLFWKDRKGFLKLLAQDIVKVCQIAEDHEMKPAFRLNGTSDILWEREFDWMEKVTWPGLRWYDYTKYPLEQRKVGSNYHLTFSIEGPHDMHRAIGYLNGGHSVAAVVDASYKTWLLDNEPQWNGFNFIDGDVNDLRFLDPPGSVVLLKPKGHVRTDLIRKFLLTELKEARFGQAA